VPGASLPPAFREVEPQRDRGFRDLIAYPRGIKAALNVRALARTGVSGEPVSKEGARETSLPGFGVSPNLNIPQDWGIEGVEKILLRQSGGGTPDNDFPNGEYKGGS